MPLQIRRGTEAQRQAMTIPLAVGEPLFVTDTGSIWVGDGVSPGGVQVTGLTLEDAVDSVAAALVAGVNQNITFVYGTSQDQANRIDARLDLSVVEGTIDADGFKGPLLADDSGVIVNSANRNITANDISANAISASNLTLTGALISSSIVSDFKGSVFGDDSTILINALESSINLDQTIKSNVIPGFDNLIDLGSSGAKFASLHLGAEGLYIDGAQIQATLSGAIDLPAGSTVGGIAIAGESLVSGSNYNINIVDDSSTLIVDSSAGIVNANTIGFHIGDTKGSVFADNSSLMVDAVDRILYGTVQTLAASFNTNSITNDGSDPFKIGETSTPIDVEFNLGNNLQLRSVDPNSKGFITSTMSRGTHTSPAAVQAGDEIGGILFRAYTDSSTVALSGLINFAVDPTAVIAGGSFVKSQIVMGAATDSALDPNSIFVLDSAGVATTNVFGANKFFQLPVFADDTARSTAIPTPAAGMMIFMTSGTTPAATNKMQLFDGSNWVNLN